jgi:hypothetical protein
MAGGARAHEQNRRPGTAPRHAATTLAAGVLLLPTAAWSHVKWFASYDVAELPMPVFQVMSAHFLLMLAGFSLLVFGGFVLDRFASRVCSATRLMGRIASPEMLPKGDPLPHLKCSPSRLIGGGRHGADQHGNT